MEPGAIESVGEAVTGGMLARAVEPEAGEALGHGEGACLNCGTELVGPYCHRCGQSGHVHRTVASWWHDLAHGVMHLDGKIWRTLPLLAWRPGDLTRCYIEGERARFVSPLALFLFSVFFMFAVFSALGITTNGMGNIDHARQDMRRALGQAQGKVASMEAQRQAAARAGKDVSKLDAQIAEERRQMENVSALAGGPDGHTTMKVGLHTGWPRLDRGIEKANANPALLFYKLQSSAYKYSWALIPISVPFLWLLFLHRRRYREQYKAYDHLVFVTYSIAFMTLAIVAIVLLRSTGFATGIAKLALFVVPPVHVYRQLRGAYRLGRLSALWRTAALLFFSGVALTVFLALLLVIGIMG